VKKSGHRLVVDYKNMDSLCLIFLQGIGDFVMLTPTLKKIKKINPSLRLAVVLRKELGLRGVAEDLGLLDEVYEISLDVHPRIYIPWIFWTYEYWLIRKKLKATLAETKFDRVKFIYTQLLPTVAYLVFCPRRIKRHKIEIFASELGITLDEDECSRTHLCVQEEILAEVRKKLSDVTGVAGMTIIGIQRNTLDRTRFIPISAVQDFVDRLNASYKNVYFVIFADHFSYSLEQEVDGRHLMAPNLKYSWEVIGTGDARRLVSLVALCDCVVSVDSAVFNIAGALEKNTIGVFNTYKVRSDERALKRRNVLCIDKSAVTADDLIERFYRLHGGRNA
jgi:ADP-heptose:LPS heptosyltransferase